jgi:hypothetical protein
VARHIFQACPVWIYTQSNITQASVLIVLYLNNLPKNNFNKELQKKYMEVHERAGCCFFL